MTRNELIKKLELKMKQIKISLVLENELDERCDELFNKEVLTEADDKKLIQLAIKAESHTTIIYDLLNEMKELLNND